MSTETFSELGYALVPGVVSHAACDGLIRHLSQLGVANAGSRTLLALPWCMQLANTLKIQPAIAAMLPSGAVAVQCTLFEKTAHKNWAVATHQDLSIPVRERVPESLCTGWARKEGVLHTQPPPAVLAKLVAVRVHLDECPPEAGALRVVPGSHRGGRLTQSEIERLRAQHGEAECAASRGAALILRPLLLHASSRVAGHGVRRVLHFLFGPQSLPYGLNWHTAV